MKDNPNKKQTRKKSVWTEYQENNSIRPNISYWEYYNRTQSKKTMDNPKEAYQTQYPKIIPPKSIDTPKESVWEEYQKNKKKESVWEEYQKRT